MNSLKTSADRSCDVLVAGTGLAGLTAAIAFAQAGFDVVSCGAAERSGRGRTVAMLDRSVAYLESLGLWPAIRPEAAPLRTLRIVDDTGALFPPRPLEFHSAEIGLDAFGWNVENDRMASALTVVAARTRGVERTSSAVARYDFSGERALARLGDGRLIACSLVIGADGRDSRARRSAGLPVRSRRYPQSALTALLTHRLPHRDASTEFHTRNGPFTLVPLPAKETASGFALSPDKDQQFLYTADYGNSRIVVLDRKSLEVLYQFGQRGTEPGNFRGVHLISTDSKGNLYAAEVAPGARVQRFIFKGLSSTPPPNALTPTQLSSVKQ